MVQFRVLPGSAVREFPILRFRPKPRIHPKTFFGADTVASISPPAAVAGYEIFDTTGAFDNKFGSTHLWVGRRKQPGRGEGSSGLRFDVAARGEDHD
jgi:hypothetical protein